MFVFGTMVEGKPIFNVPLGSAFISMVEVLGSLKLDSGWFEVAAVIVVVRVFVAVLDVLVTGVTVVVVAIVGMLLAAKAVYSILTVNIILYSFTCIL